jgi:hypothetical protein
VTRSEEWFDRYVREHGHDPGSPEPDLGIAKNPDRLITWNGVEVVNEIKQFENDPFARLLDRFGTMGMSQGLRPVRKAIERAARQLKPLAGRGLPLVVVLANPKGMPVAFTSDEIIWALYGNPVWRMAIDRDTGASAGPTEYGVDRDGQIRNQHQYLSAVVALRHRTEAQDWTDALWARLKEEHAPFNPVGDPDRAAHVAALALEDTHRAEEAGEIPEGDYLFADVFVTMGAEATALPETVFDGPRDSRWEFDVASGTYARVHALEGA